MNHNFIHQVRNEKPLIHNITNEVVMNFTANGLLAFGGSPIMANAVEEAADVTKLSNALVLNIGTLTEPQIKAMIIAGKAANELNIPVVFDPVGAPATTFRSEACERILAEVHPTLIKGNTGELAHLVGEEVETKGVDSTGSGDREYITQQASQKYGTGAVCTGETDVVCINGEIAKNGSGHPLLARVTGTGCLLGSIMAAVLSVEGPVMGKVMAALSHYGKAAEKAASHPAVEGSGTFAPYFIDALSSEIGERYL